MLVGMLLFAISMACYCGGGGDGGNSASVSSGTINLAWDPPTINADGSPLIDLAGYIICYGTASGTYDHFIDVGNVTAYNLTGLAPGQTYYIVTTAYDTSNNQSIFSNEVNGLAR
jgi:hypothetical protein